MEEKKKLICPLCGSKEFNQERGKLDSHWGMTALKVDMLICKQCNHVILFGTGKTFFGNFD